MHEKGGRSTRGELSQAYVKHRGLQGIFPQIKTTLTMLIYLLTLCFICVGVHQKFNMELLISIFKACPLHILLIAVILR